MSYDILPGFMWRDETTDNLVEQNYDPSQGIFVPQAGVNTRVVTDPVTGTSRQVGDRTVTYRGTKSILWSSEGCTSPLGQTIPPLSSGQKGAPGTDLLTNQLSGPLDFSPYTRVILMAQLVSLTGGSSPTIQFGITFQDDEASPLILPAWTSAAISTAASGLYAAIGSGISGSAPSAPSGWTYALVNLPLAPQGHFTWTLAGSPTAAAWKATLYGIS